MSNVSLKKKAVMGSTPSSGSGSGSGSSIDHGQDSTSTIRSGKEIRKSKNQEPHKQGDGAEDNECEQEQSFMAWAFHLALVEEWTHRQEIQEAQDHLVASTTELAPFRTLIDSTQSL